MRKKTELGLWLVLYGGLLLYAVVAVITKDWHWPLHVLKTFSGVYSNGVRSGGAKTPLLFLGQIMPLGNKGLFRFLAIIVGVLFVLAAVALWWRS